MAVATAPTPILPDEDLTDEQIEGLLARATARRQQKSKSTDVSKITNTQSFNFPKLDTGNLDQPYVSTRGDIATVDASRLLEVKSRKQANEIRKVEDPVAAKKAAIVVSRTHISLLILWR